jgi:hypothetical protein
MRIYNHDLKEFEEVPVTNERKPHRLNSGYIAELKNRRTGIGHVVIYKAKEAGISTDEGYNYAVVCETHSCFVSTTSLPSARTAMKAVDFCEKCMEVGK